MSSEDAEPETHPTREVVTREDLSDFRNFLLQQIKLHTSEPSLKLTRTLVTCDTERTVTVSKQLKVESDRKGAVGNLSATLKF